MGAAAQNIRLHRFRYENRDRRIPTIATQLIPSPLLLKGSLMLLATMTL
jgi:hypothetical protein